MPGGICSWMMPQGLMGEKVVETFSWNLPSNWKTDCSRRSATASTSPDSNTGTCDYAVPTWRSLPRWSAGSRFRKKGFCRPDWRALESGPRESGWEAARKEPQNLPEARKVFPPIDFLIVAGISLFGAYAVEQDGVAHRGNVRFG